MSNPIAIRGFDHIVLRVRDKARMLAFYCDVLGLSVDKEQPHVGLTHIRAGPQMIDLITLDGPLGRLGGAAPGAEGRNLDHFALAIEPFDREALGAHLTAHGVEILEEGPRYGAEGEGPSIYIRDPEGNIVELKGPSNN